MRRTKKNLELHTFLIGVLGAGFLHHTIEPLVWLSYDLLLRYPGHSELVLLSLFLYSVVLIYVPFKLVQRMIRLAQWLGSVLDRLLQQRVQQ